MKSARHIYSIARTIILAPSILLILVSFFASSWGCLDITKRHQSPNRSTASKVAVGFLGDKIADGYCRLEEVVVTEDASLVSALQRVLRHQTLQQQRLTTFDLDIYAILLADDGTPLDGAAFNGDWLQTVEFRKDKTTYFVRRPRSLPAADSFSRAGGVTRALWQAAHLFSHEKQ